jgi:tetratricopeptide (TPR) repeat protein
MTSLEQCPKCRRFSRGASLVCPHCGAELVETKPRWRLFGTRRARPAGTRPRASSVQVSEAAPTLSQVSQPQEVAPIRDPGPDPTSTAQPKRKRRVKAASTIEGSPVKKRRWWITVLVAILAITVFVGGLAASAYAGIYDGERDRETRRATLIEDHYRAGIQALNDGRFERALAEFEYVLGVEGDHALAQQGVVEARARLVVKPTPTLEVAQSVAELLLDQAQASYEEENWVAAARTLTQLRALDPLYEQVSVEQMLFKSLYEAGQGYLAEEQLEVAISYLDQAIALQPLDADVILQRNLAIRYLDALTYWGVNWDLCIQRLEALHATAPNYRDVAQRIHRAYIEHGDDLAQRGEMCPAEIQYTRALRLYANARVEDKRASVAQVCLIATPIPQDGAEPVLTPQPIIGFSMGRLSYPVYNAASGVYDLYALYADGRIIRVAASADQASWEWGSGRLVYRSRGSGSLRLILPEEGIPLDLVSADQPAWPTLSPDSQRIAYAAREADGTWGVYVANTNSTGEPRRLGAGWAPAWGRGGLIAYTGCTTDGGCGIILDNPDDDQPGVRLTGSANDVAVSWAPGGNLMAYMSNVTGSWNIFLLNPEGGVQQLTSTPSDDGLPAWSPDGSRLAFVSNRSGNWGIYVGELGALSSGSGQIDRVLDLGPSLPGWENQRLSWSP